MLQFEANKLTARHHCDRSSTRCQSLQLPVCGCGHMPRTQSSGQGVWTGRHAGVRSPAGQGPHTQRSNTVFTSGTVHTVVCLQGLLFSTRVACMCTNLCASGNGHSIACYRCQACARLVAPTSPAFGSSWPSSPLLPNPQVRSCPRRVMEAVYSEPQATTAGVISSSMSGSSCRQMYTRQAESGFCKEAALKRSAGHV